MYAHFLLVCDSNTLGRLRAALPFSSRGSAIGAPLAIATLLISLKPIPDLNALVLDQNVSSYAFIWKLALSDRSAIAVDLIQKAKLTRSMALWIIEAVFPSITDLPGCPPWLPPIAEHLLPFLPSKLLDGRGSAPPPPVSLQWEEDRHDSEASALPANHEHNIWVEQRVARECVKTTGGRRVGFFCHTCPRQELLCLNCAVHCHRGHAIAFGRTMEFTCKCASFCECGHQESAPEGPAASVDAAAIIRLLCALSHSDTATAPAPRRVHDRAIRPQLSKDLRSYAIQDLEIRRAEPRVRLEALHRSIIQPRPVAPAPCDKQLPAAVPRLADCADDFLFIAVGDHVRVFNLANFEAVGGFQVGGPILTLVARRGSSGPVLLAPGCLRSFEIIAFQPRAPPRRLLRVPRAGDGHILSMEWVSDHLAVLWPDSLEIYAADARESPIELTKQMARF
jgi:hypothetical protein